MDVGHLFKTTLRQWRFQRRVAPRFWLVQAWTCEGVRRGRQAAVSSQLRGLRTY